VGEVYLSHDSIGTFITQCRSWPKSPHMMPRRGGLLERICREQWNVGVIRQRAADIVQNGITEPVHWLPSLRSWFGWADPGVYVVQDRVQVFVERLNWLTGRGQIWSGRLQDTHLVFDPWVTSPLHLSYPFPLRVHDSLYFTMETHEASALYIWEKTATSWIQHKILDRPAVDPTIWYDDHGWWLFCTFADDQPNRNLHLFFADRIEGTWVPHPKNPVKTDPGSSRPAGPLFRANGRLVRPGQDCTQTYGGALVLNAITELSRTGFRERPIRRLNPLHDYPDGLHTLCPAGEVTLIDGKRWVFHPLDLLRYPIAAVSKQYRRTMARAKFVFK